MPIKPENKARYPDNWKAISIDIRTNRANNRCEVCGVQNYSVGHWIYGEFKTVDQIIEALNEKGIDLTMSIPLEAKPIRIILTVAHLDHQPENCDYSNLKAMCQRCHNNYDSKHRSQTRKRTRNKGQASINFDAP